MARTLDNTHTLLSYVKGSLKNVIVVNGEEKRHGFIFSLLNPPVPLGGNIISLDVYVDELPVQRKSVYVATSEEVVNAASLSESRPIPFKPFQSARFLVVHDGGLDDSKAHKIVVMSKLEGFEDIAIPFTFTDRISGYQKERIHITSDSYDAVIASGDTIFKNFTSPLVLSGKKAYVVCSSNGALSANWSWMGVRYDNGGLYVPPTRAFGRIIVEVSMDDGVRKRLPNFVVSSTHERGSLTTQHELAGLRVRRKLLVPFESRGFIMVIDLELAKSSLRKPAGKKRKVRLHFLIDGNITSYGLAAISQSNITKFNAKDSCLQISSAGATKNDKVQYFGTIGVAPKSMKPSKILTDSFDNDLELSYDVEIDAGAPVQIALVGTGSFSSAGECLREFRSMRDSYAELAQETEDIFTRYSSSTTAITTQAGKQSQSVSKLVRAFEKAKACLQYLKAEYDGLGEGICAGLPRFPNYWARDTGWSLRGYLSIGDYDFARAVIDNFLSHQAKKTAGGAVAGELPMIISGRAFLHNTTFGSADSTFLFPWAIREYVLATADVKYLQKRWDSIMALVDCGLLKDIDGDGLVDHGFTGTAEKMPIRDSTWMDHIDRRKSANDVQALFYESLVIGSELAGIVGDGRSQDRWARRAEQLKTQIDREYWNEKTGYYNDTIRRDGSKDASIRPNALVLLLTGAAKDRSRVDSVLDRIEKDDLSAAWGVRTLSTQDPKYQPALYHDGAVWPLVTGWAAVSEIKAGRAEQGLAYINSMADRILAENGMFAETYRGDRPEPFNSCILQAWSVGMYAYAVREMALGMKLDLLHNKISFEPQIPEPLAGRAPVAFEHNTGRGRLGISIDPYNRKISVLLKGWRGARPEFSASPSYGIDVKLA
jgi:GH15 family glucan-1,4-alpha-glucosidase